MYLQIIPQFLSPEKCQELIALSEEMGYEEATITTSLGFLMRKDVRDNSRVFYKNENLAEELWQMLAPKLQLVIPDHYQPIGLNELFRFYKYEDNQRFNWHQDGNYRRNKEEISFYTFMIYLNDNFEGGETDFREYPAIRPETGAALLFLHNLKHKGCEVPTGTKYVVRTDVMYRIQR